MKKEKRSAQSRVKSFIFCVHAHQPVGNFDRVFAEAYEKCYRPFFQVLEKHPAFAFCCHLSGSLMDWLVANKPAFIRMLERMCARGQVEFLGGGYYEPIYGAIPEDDLAGQIRMTRQKLGNLFGQQPNGAWLTERVWDPPLVRILKKNGIDYTVLDDFHLEKGGIRHPVTGYYQARHGRDWLDVFASARPLRYLIPFRRPEDTLNYIHSLDGGPESVLVFADDCEKFGLWPGTDGWVYKQRWLDRLLTLLEDDPAVALYTFSRFRAHHRPRQAVDIPHASYTEMMEWSGGSFHNFFKKYPESLYMSDRMKAVSRSLKEKESLLDAGTLEEAKKALYQAQCNCAYWHGIFGGIYLHHLRSAVFENLIRIETLLAGTQAKKKGSADSRIGLVELESGLRWTVRQKNLAVFFNARYGAALEELDYLPMSVNLMCNLQRHKEPYHGLVLGNGLLAQAAGLFSIHQLLGMKDRNLDRQVFYDHHHRLSFMDHFLRAEACAEEFAKVSYKEIGDFLGTAFKARLVGKGSEERILFEREGSLRLGNKKYPFRVAKLVIPDGESGFKVCYHLKNLSAEFINFTFGVEFNFSIGQKTAPKVFSEKNATRWIFEDSWRGAEITLSANTPMDLVTIPVETVSGSEAGLEKTYQGLGILLQKTLRIGPHQARQIMFGLEVR